MSKPLLTYRAYNWDEYDSIDNDSRLCINSWGLTDNGESCLVRYDTFVASCYMELVEVCSKGTYAWSKTKAESLFQNIQDSMRDHAPFNYVYLQMDDLFNYKLRKKPYMLLLFKSQDSCNHWYNKVHGKLFESRNLDCRTFMFNVYEHRIYNARKMLTAMHRGYSEWITVDATLVPDHEKISTLPLEYTANFKTMQPVILPPGGIPFEPKILAFDLECNSENPKAFPQKENIEDVVYLVSCIYQKGKDRRRYAISLGPSPEVEGVTSITALAEEELCDKFMELIADLDVDIVTGYNISGFDFPYLNTRLSLFRLFKDADGKGSPWLAKGSRLLNVKPKLIRSSVKNNGEEIYMPGRVCFDLYYMIRRDYGRLPNFRLGTVAKHFINKDKMPVTPSEMFRIYKAHREMTWEEKENNEEFKTVKKYCIHDSELVLDIMDAIRVIPKLVDMSNIYGVNTGSLYNKGQMERGISQIYDAASKAKIVLNTRSVPEVDYEGGHVMEPMLGLHKNAITLDFSSMYPSIIIAYNICYTTYISPDMEGISDDECWIYKTDDTPAREEAEILPGYTVTDDEGIRTFPNKKSVLAYLNIDDIDSEYVGDGVIATYGIQSTKIIPGTKGRKYRFIKQDIEKHGIKKVGLLPQLVKSLVDMRSEVRKEQRKYEEHSEIWELLEIKQGVYKISANSLYGLLGYQKGPLAFIEGALSVTGLGRNHIQECREYLERVHSATIIYGDTDSLMLLGPKDIGRAELMQLGHSLAKELTVKLLRPPLNVFFEKAGNIFLKGKKAYIYHCIDKDTNELTQLKDAIVRGLTPARTDNSLWQRRTISKELKMVMSRYKMQDTLDMLITEVHNLCYSTIPYDDVIIIKGFGKDYKNERFFVNVYAQQLRKYGREALPGDKLEYVVVRNEYTEWSGRDNPDDNILGFRMRPPDISDMSMVDCYYYLNNLLANSADSIFNLRYKKEIARLEEENNVYDMHLMLQHLWPKYHVRITKLTDEGCNEEMILEELNKMAPSQCAAARRKYISGKNLLELRKGADPVSRLAEAYKCGFLQEAIKNMASPEKYKELYGSA